MSCDSPRCCPTTTTTTTANPCPCPITDSGGLTHFTTFLVEVNGVTVGTGCGNGADCDCWPRNYSICCAQAGSCIWNGIATLPGLAAGVGLQYFLFTDGHSCLGGPLPAITIVLDDATNKLRASLFTSSVNPAIYEIDAALVGCSPDGAFDMEQVDAGDATECTLPTTLHVIAYPGDNSETVPQCGPCRPGAFDSASQSWKFTLEGLTSTPEFELGFPWEGCPGGAGSWNSSLGCWCCYFNGEYCMAGVGFERNAACVWSSAPQGYGPYFPIGPYCKFLPATPLADTIVTNPEECLSESDIIGKYQEAHDRVPSFDPENPGFFGGYPQANNPACGKLNATLIVAGGVVQLQLWTIGTQDPWSFPRAVFYEMPAKDFDFNGENELNKAAACSWDPPCEGFPSTITITPSEECGEPPPPPPPTTTTTTTTTCAPHPCLPLDDYELTAEWGVGVCTTNRRGCADSGSSQWSGDRTAVNLQVDFVHGGVAGFIHDVCEIDYHWSIEKAANDDPAGCVMRLTITDSVNETLATYICSVASFLCDESSITVTLESDVTDGCIFGASATVRVYAAGDVPNDCGQCYPCGDGYSPNLKVTFGALSLCCLPTGVGCNWKIEDSVIPAGPWAGNTITIYISFLNEPTNYVIMSVLIESGGANIARWQYILSKESWNCASLSTNTMALMSESCGSTHTSDLAVTAPASLNVVPGGC